MGVLSQDNNSQVEVKFEGAFAWKEDIVKSRVLKEYSKDTNLLFLLSEDGVKENTLFQHTTFNNCICSFFCLFQTKVTRIEKEERKDLKAILWKNLVLKRDKFSLKVLDVVLPQFKL